MQSILSSYLLLKFDENKETSLIVFTEVLSFESNKSKTLKLNNSSAVTGKFGPFGVNFRAIVSFIWQD